MTRPSHARGQDPLQPCFDELTPYMRPFSSGVSVTVYLGNTDSFCLGSRRTDEWSSITGYHVSSDAFTYDGTGVWVLPFVSCNSWFNGTDKTILDRYRGHGV
jgi:hypothetical protein